MARYVDRCVKIVMILIFFTVVIIRVVLMIYLRRQFKTNRFNKIKPYLNCLTFFIKYDSYRFNHERIIVIHVETKNPKTNAVARIHDLIYKFQNSFNLPNTEYTWLIFRHYVIL